MYSILTLALVGFTIGDQELSDFFCRINSQFLYEYAQYVLV